MYFKDVVKQSLVMDAHDKQEFNMQNVQTEKTWTDRLKNLIRFANHNFEVQKRILNTFR